MARQRRGGGFRPPELRGTLGTLLRTALAQAGPLRDVLERNVREGRSRLDSALSNRRRHDALAELGELVLALIRRGEIDLDELPEARDLVAHLDEIDAGHAADHDEDFAAPPARNRFDSRHRDDDGTVSSRTWSRSKPAAPAPARVWRPPVDTDDDTSDEKPALRKRADADHADDITTPDRPSARRTSRAPESAPAPARTAVSRDAAAPAPTPSRATPRKDPLRTGGIHFDDDDDLAEYMHPDDVPPKNRPDGDS